MTTPPPLHIPEKQFHAHSAERAAELPALLAPRRSRTKVVAPACIRQDPPVEPEKNRSEQVARLLIGNEFG